MITIKSPREMELMRKAGKIVGSVLKTMEQEVKPGITTAALDQIAEDVIRSQKAIPAFKGYCGYPATICISVNDEVVHGIPGERVLAEGDIVGIDVGAIVSGFYGDAARTFAVGRIDKAKQELMDVTRGSLEKGIEQIVAGNRISDISHAVEEYVKPHKYGIVRQYVGHGIGSQLHEEPQVPNFGKPNHGPEIKVGMALAIEPMINLGSDQVKTLDDGWTVVTMDGKASAHFENTVLVTNEGIEILTEYA